MALKKLDEIEHQIMAFKENPYMRSDPQYRVLRRQGYKVLILEENLVFYKINDEKREITVYAVIDQRQDYIKIIGGL